MMILAELGFQRAQTFVLEHLIAFHFASGDLRWVMIALALRSFSAMWAFGHERLLTMVLNAARRIGQKARFAAEIAHADTMVAAGGR
ncbi:hypothetical protein [Bradyrhizobium sp. Ash2021]|jgi:hypothetical protein|uniref:hypothetical protein n=1 Tax=Bradyrhizobium sp. Ash2021 TaxID=2954771 RepID=UPI00092624F5|nr:hypothetical protein [Bradyrhizobium sp. Ash2021]WMT74255.1 hypothetical protein NL528_41240 [Bradyrhizobium sp. Ash2021]SIO19678.1 hypothetical protein SAMN05443247_02709 [Bradyrhizobium erythrophlei]